jgi:glycosyltransferase involved in cell wall biosynthesis
VRVLYLNPFSQEVSGPDESLLTLLGALVPLGVEPHLVLPRPGPQVPRYEALGVKVHFAPLTVLQRGLGPADVARLCVQLLRGGAAVHAIARRERIELIHTNMEVVLDGGVVSRLLRIPHVLHYRGNTNDDPKLVFDLLTRFWTATAEHVFCISRATSDIFHRRGRGGRVETLYNPVDVDAFQATERSTQVRRELGALDGDLLIGTVGRIHPRKDVATFLRAAAGVLRQLPRARFVVVGSAETEGELRYRSELEAQATQLGLANVLTWAGARRDIPRVMKALDVFVLCSRNEGFGRVVAEAMAAGVPVVAAREGAMPELLTGPLAALLARPADPDDFAAKILGALAGPPASSGLEGFALRPADVARHVLSVYERISSHHGSGALA